MAKKLKHYRVYGTVTGGKYLGEYEAVTTDAAVQAALEEHGGPISLCHQCSSECEDGAVESAVAEEIEPDHD